MCREYLAQLRERISELEARGFQVIVIAPSKGTFINQFLEQFGPFPFPIIGDPSREAYRGMGHKTMPKWKLLSKAAFGFITGKVKGFVPDNEKQKEFVMKSMKTQNVYIQGGTWLFSPQGKILWKHIDESPENHAKIADVLKKMDEVKA
ncbi:AhpC/TSA family protein [Cytobacillus oceanisediminis]|uniref:peroxiredoxin-like family protein n=1 Tax=Cytobacillus oceanisediminis TaxID=665099 RepID=UPI001863DA95|nr:peroxiredoxin-like family protein [Cytobacillus oceanisediminis]QOK27159.1 AhpC/TSA family protein [Cytobacillus oceanisediminis]